MLQPTSAPTTHIYDALTFCMYIHDALTSWCGLTDFPPSTLQVAFAWAASIEPAEGTQLLMKLGLLDEALEYALESGAFAQAFQLCQAPAAQHKMPECHLKYAMYLEDEGMLCAAHTHSF